MLRNFSCFCFNLLTFSKISFMNTIRVSNSLDSVGPDLGQNFLQGLSTDDKSATSKEGIN